MLVQNPNFFGSINDFTELFAAAAAQKAVSVISSYPVLQSLLKTPGEMGADVAVAEGQSLGLPLSFGGPYLGVMTCTKKMVRQMPGRIVGRTVDGEGRTGYVLTLQAREQHIRRQKATSNICSNQSLCALRALVHLCALGELGLKRAARISVERAHACADRLTAIDGVDLLTKGAFGNEFAVTLPVNSYEVIANLTARGFVPGFPWDATTTAWKTDSWWPAPKRPAKNRSESSPRCSRGRSNEDHIRQIRGRTRRVLAL